MLKINSKRFNHLISNQADFSLEALKKCFIYKYRRNKKPLCQTRKSQNTARTRSGVGGDLNSVFNMLVSQLLKSQYFQT